MSYLAFGHRRAWLPALLLVVVACAPGTASTPPAPTATAEAAQRAGQALAANLLTGVLRQVNGSSLTVQNQDGTVNATLAPNALVLKQTSVPLGELRVGDEVTFVGQRDSTGTMLARQVRASPQGLGDALVVPFAIDQTEAPNIEALRDRVRNAPAGSAQGPVQRQGGSVARAPGELTIAGPVEAVQGDAIVVSSASVTYTVRLAENGQVIRIAPAEISDLQPGQRITGRGEQRNDGWTLTTLVLLGEARGLERGP